jgi:AcrR family transcriptional regulator
VRARLARSAFRDAAGKWRRIPSGGKASCCAITAARTTRCRCGTIRSACRRREYGKNTYSTVSNRRGLAKAGRPSTKREQREFSLERIQRSALKLFVSKGYRATTVDDIAAASGLTKGAIYFYYPSKAAILFPLLDEVERLLVDQMVERVAKAGARAQEKLVALMHGQSVVAADKAEYYLLFLLMLLEFKGAEDEIEARTMKIYRRIYQSIEEVVQRGKIAGEFRTDLTTREVASIILATHNGTFIEWYCRSTSLSGRDLVRSAREVVLNGLLKAG